MTWKSGVKEWREQLKTSVPTTLGMLVNKVPWIISIYFAGQLGSNQLAAAALATTICNITGMSFSVGLSSALTTFTGRARGTMLQQQQRRRRRPNDLEPNKRPTKPQQQQQDYDYDTDNDNDENDNEQVNEDHDDDEETAKLVDHDDDDDDDDLTDTDTTPKQPLLLLPMVYLIRGMVIQCVLMIPIGIWWVVVGVESSLVALGQGPELAAETASFLRILFLSLVGYASFWTLACWLQALEIADTLAVASVLGLLIHWPCNWLLVHVWQWGNTGVAWAIVINKLIQPLYLFWVSFGPLSGRQRVLASMGGGGGGVCLSFWNEARVAVSSVSEMVNYLALAVPGIVVISEWWASESAIFLSGRLAPDPSAALDGMTIYQSINTFFFMFPIGTSVATSARVGNFLGSNQPDQAALAATVGVCTALGVSAVCGILLLGTPHHLLPSLFSPDPHVVEQTARTIPLLALYVVGDGMQITFNGIIKGCGRQCITMPIVVVAYWVVGLPLGYYLTFTKHGGEMCDNNNNYNDDNLFCGIVGLVFGLTVGTWVHMFLLAIVVVLTTDWNAEAEKAQLRTENS